MADDKPAPPPRTKLFWFNLITLLLLVPLATVVFDRHLKAYFTQIVLVGGALTLWALIRLLWSVFSATTKFDVEDFSRTQLSSPATTRMLIVAIAVLGYLWWSAASLYFEFTGDAAKSYKIEVVNTGTEEHYARPFEMTAAEPVVMKGLQLIGGQDVPLTCQIAEPVGYEPLDCSIRRGNSTLVKVPKDFTAKEYHLVQLLPLGPLYRVIPSVEQVEASNYSLNLTVTGHDGKEGTPMQLADLRRGTVNLVPTAQADGGIVLKLGDSDNQRQAIVSRFVSDGSDREDAEKTAAILVAQTKNWPVAYLQKGDRLSIAVLKSRHEGNSTSSDVASATRYEVTDAALDKIITSTFLDDVFTLFVSQIPLVRGATALPAKRVIELPINGDDLPIGQESIMRVEFAFTVARVARKGSIQLWPFAMTDSGKLGAGVKQALVDQSELPLVDHWNQTLPELLSNASVQGFLVKHEPDRSRIIRTPQ